MILVIVNSREFFRLLIKFGTRFADVKEFCKSIATSLHLARKSYIASNERLTTVLTEESVSGNMKRIGK